jgi:hypothetical protein
LTLYLDGGKASVVTHLFMLGDRPTILIIFFYYSYVHTMFGSFLPSPPTPSFSPTTPSLLSRNYFALTSNFVVEPPFLGQVARLSKWPKDGLQITPLSPEVELPL